MYRNNEPLCCITGTNIGQLYFKSKQTKEIRLVVKGGSQVGELGEGSQKV